MTIHENGSGWIVRAADRQLEIDTNTLVLTLTDTAAGRRWTTVRGEDHILLRTEEGERLVRLADAAVKTFEIRRSGYYEGVYATLSGFPDADDASGAAQRRLSVRLSVLLYTHTGELVCELHPLERDAGDIVHIAWPAPFGFGGEAPGLYTAVPMMQGFLVPADWEAEIVRYEDGFFHGRDAYMPWWGQTDGEHGYTAIVDTFWDAKGHFDHAPRLHSHFGVRWLPSLGRYDDNRSVRYRFGPKMDYVEMAKIYRAYVKSIGRFRSMAEKIAENPRVGRLLGAAVVNTLIHFYAVPESDYYDPDHPEKNDERHSFALRAEQLAKLKDAYDGPVYVHLDGWGQRGYDNLHPDVLPPSPVNGGWEGMRLLRQRCEELGYLLALHDQYRDFYHDAPSYGAEQAVMDRDGNNELCTIWPGGAHHFLSASLAKGYVERNYEQLESEGVLPDGAYLDVFAVIALEEDYHPAHPMTRKSCMEHRLSCFHSIRSRGMIASSEEPVDWALPALDLVHHGPYARNPNPGKGPVVGVPVPLFSLVYHDAVFLPWFPGEGEWGIPPEDWGFLHGLLNAGLPCLNIEPTAAEVALAREMSELHLRVGGLEMTGHSFIDGNLRRQRAVYEDGTVVEIDLDTKEYAVRYGEETADVRSPRL